MKESVWIGAIFTLAIALVLLFMLPVRSEVTYVAQLTSVEHHIWGADYYYFSNGRVESYAALSGFSINEEVIGGTYEVVNRYNIFGWQVFRNLT